jgi:uncharacterized RDD family membrane protein YckC
MGIKGEIETMANGGESSGRPDKSSASPSPLDERYYVRGETEALGPYEGRALKDMIEQGRVLPTTAIARVGDTQWVDVKSHPYFSTLRPAGFAASQATSAQAPFAQATSAHTTSALPEGVEYAGFWIRLAAYFLDGIFLAAIEFAVGLVLGIIGIIGGVVSTQGSKPEFGVGTVLFFIFSYLIYFGIIVAYNIIFMSGPWQATPGKRIVRIHLITVSGAKVSRWLAFGRVLAYIISALPLDIGFMVIGWNSEKKGFHDMMCGTRVIFGRL